MRRYQIASWVCAAVLLGARLTPAETPAPAAEPPTDPQATSPPSPAAASSSYGITGDWLGLRPAAEKAGLDIQGFIFLDLSKNLRGGLDTAGYQSRSLLDLHLLADTAAIGLPGGAAYLDLQAHDENGDGDVLVGDVQAYDNTESPRFVAVMQAWVRQPLGDNLLLKIGRIDANATPAAANGPVDGFAILEHGGDFIHSAAGYPPPAFAMPTYPDPAPGIQLFYGKNDGPYLGGGAFYSNGNRSFSTLSGHPESPFSSTGGTFFIAELGSRWNWNDKPGHAALGGWYHTGNFARPGDPAEFHRGAGGGYAFLDQSLYQEKSGDQVTRDLGLLCSAALSDSGAAPMTQGLMLGLAATGFTPSRPDDSMGVLSSWTQLASAAPLNNSFEWQTEAFYKIQLTSWAAVKPVFTYIVTPSGLHPDAAVVTLRLEVHF